MAEQALINDPTALLVFFAGFVALIFVLAQTRPFNRLFRYLPPIVWIYLLPVVLTTAGITPAESAFYDWCTDYLMPCSLLLLVLATDVPAIRRLGPLAAAMLLSGSVGIVIGGPIALAIFQPFLDDPQVWKGLGALSGSWIGGLSNMIAIKEGVGAPDDVFSPMIIVDSVVGYGWMSIVILLSGYQNRIDRWNRARCDELNALNQRLQQVQAENARPITLPAFASMLGVGLVASWLCMRGGELLPQVGSVLSHFTWGILLVVAVGLGLSFTPIRRLEHRGATPVAYGGLYLMVATMGAGGDLAAIAEAPLVLAVGAVWIGIHVACLFLAMRLLRAPVFLFATGSMGNVGGVISTPVVAGVFQPALAAVGVLMGVLGNLVGTPLGLLCAQLMAWVARACHGAASL